MSHPTGFQVWVKSIALIISNNPYYPYQTFDIAVNRSEGRQGWSGGSAHDGKSELSGWGSVRNSDVGIQNILVGFGRLPF